MPYRSVLLSFLLAAAVAIPANANAVPPVVTGVSFGATEGVQLTSQIVANVTDAAAGTASALSATIDWGDGVTQTGTVTSTGTPGQFTVSGTHTYADEGSYTVAVSVTDTGTTLSGNGSGTATVADADVLNGTVVAIAPVEGASFSGTVANFTDTYTASVAGNFTATIAWGDGVTDSGVAITGFSGAFAVSGSHTYQEEGSYTLKVTLTETAPGTATNTAQRTISVSDAPLSGSAVAIAPTAGTPFSGVVANFTDADPNGAAGDYTATINWGDGTTTPGTIGPGFTVSGTHTYASGYGGAFTLSVTVNDVGGATLTRSTPIAVGVSPLFVPVFSPWMLALLALAFGAIALKGLR